MSLQLHLGINCDSCGKKDFPDQRYKCVTCYDYDLCRVCHINLATTLSHVATHSMQLIGLSQHTNINCDSCHKLNFTGKRFKCTLCHDYDLCEDCHNAGSSTQSHAATHPMQCISLQSDALGLFTFKTNSDRNSDGSGITNKCSIIAPATLNHLPINPSSKEPVKQVSVGRKEENIEYLEEKLRSLEVQQQGEKEGLEERKKKKIDEIEKQFEQEEMAMTEAHSVQSESLKTVIRLLKEEGKVSGPTLSPAAEQGRPKAPECPVCMERMASPMQIFHCTNGHNVCGNCKPRLTRCYCSGAITGRAIDMEKFIRENGLQ